MRKFFNFLKEVWGWFVAVLIVFSGWFLIDKFFLCKSEREKELLSDIKTTEEKIKDLTTQAEGKLTEEKELEKQQAKIQEKMDSIKAEKSKKDEEFKEKKKQKTTHKGNIDYIGEKYKNVK